MKNTKDKDDANKEIFNEDKDIKQVQQQNTRIEAAEMGLKTVVLWIYNINQNGTANIFHEEISQHLTKDKDGNVTIEDMSPELVAEFLANLTTAKEIKMPDLGVRLIVFVYNCNQNGANNSAAVSTSASNS